MPLYSQILRLAALPSRSRWLSRRRHSATDDSTSFPSLNEQVAGLDGDASNSTSKTASVELPRKLDDTLISFKFETLPEIPDNDSIPGVMYSAPSALAPGADSSSIGGIPFTPLQWSTPPEHATVRLVSRPTAEVLPPLPKPMKSAIRSQRAAKKARARDVQQVNNPEPDPEPFPKRPNGRPHTWTYIDSEEYVTPSSMFPKSLEGIHENQTVTLGGQAEEETQYPEGHPLRPRRSFEDENTRLVSLFTLLHERS